MWDFFGGVLITVVQRLTWLENIFTSPIMGPIKFANRRFGIGTLSLFSECLILASREPEPEQMMEGSSLWSSYTIVTTPSVWRTISA